MLKNFKNKRVFAKIFIIFAALLSIIQFTGYTKTVMANEPASCKLVRFTDPSWTDISATTGVATNILQALGYETTIYPLSVPVGYASLSTGDIDVFLGYWDPSMTADLQKYLDNGTVETLRYNLTGAKYTLAVPRYAFDAGLKTFSDIARFGEELEYKIYGIEPGNDGNRTIMTMISDDAYGLGSFQIVESSEQAMLSEVRAFGSEKKPIVFLGWEPHPMNANIDMVYLSGDEEYFGPNYGSAKVGTNIRHGYAEECSNVGQFLKNLVFTAQAENEIMGAILDDGKEPAVASKEWLQQNHDAILPWLENVTTYDGKDAVAAIDAAFFNGIASLEKVEVTPVTQSTQTKQAEPVALVAEKPISNEKIEAAPNVVKTPEPVALVAEKPISSEKIEAAPNVVKAPEPVALVAEKPISNEKIEAAPNLVKAPEPDSALITKQAQEVTPKALPKAEPVIEKKQPKARSVSPTKKSYKLPIGKSADYIVQLLQDHARIFFDTVRIGLNAVLKTTLSIFLLPNPYVLIAILGLIAWFMQRDVKIVILTLAGFLYVINQGYWVDTMETLTLLFWSCILCMGIGVPIGIIAAHRPKFYRFIQPILDLMQTLPTFVYLIPAIIFFRIGMVPGLIATIVFVIPAPIRLTQQGISSTPSALLEAAKSFGCNPRQTLWKIELPFAMPQIRAGMTQTIMLSLSMVVIAATVGGNGLGVKVYRALQQNDAALGFEAGCVIVVVAIVLDRLFRPGKEK